MPKHAREPVPFTSVRVTRRYRDYAACRAVLVPLYGPFAARTHVDHCAEVERRGLELLNTWRQRVDALAASGYEWPLKSRWPIQLDARRHYLLNCAPTFFWARPGNFRHCTRVALCPWCCGRQAAETYDRLESILFPRAEFPPRGRRRRTKEPQPHRRVIVPLGVRIEDRPAFPVRAQGTPDDLPPQSRYTLIARRTTHPVKFTPFIRSDGFEKGGAPINPRSPLWGIIPERIEGFADPGGRFMHGRPYEFARAKEYGLLGGIEHMRVDVDHLRKGRTRVGRPPTHWRITYRQLFLAPPGWEPSPECIRWFDHKAFTGTWWRHSEPTRHELAKQVGWLCEYAKGLMQLDDIDRIAELLACRERRRLSASYGMFRGAPTPPGG